MKPQYVFSIVAVAATAALLWHPTPPTPVTTTRLDDGLEVRITKHAQPHRFEELPVPSLLEPDPQTFESPKSYLRMRLCAGDDAMLAGVQGRLLLSKGEGVVFGRLLGACGADASVCARVTAALEADAGLTADELRFFADGALSCDRDRFSALRSNPRFPLDVRMRAWTLMADAGEWSPELEALVEEQLAEPGDLTPWRLASLLGGVRTENPALLDASVRLMERSPVAAHLLRRAQTESVRIAACAKVGCDAGVAAPVDAGIDQREQLAACALQGRSYEDASCLDQLAILDWPIARSVAQRIEPISSWSRALRTFETREAFDAFASSFGATPELDGAFNPERLLGEFSAASRAPRSSKDGLGSDELAARWATLAPELHEAFFFESAEDSVGVRLSGRLGDELYGLQVRREQNSLDARAALALLNVMVGERGSPRRFFLLKSGWGPLARFAEPERVAKLVKLGLIELEDPDEARSSEE